MTPGAKPRILCVDDEPNLLEGLALHLGRRYTMHTAPGGDAGLALIEREGPFAVVLSDMRMPGMNGAQFLARVRVASPPTVRMLLTGQTDLESAVAAINDGQIFRFLTKPCAPERLLAAFQAATEQHHLVIAERELLEHTLMGSIQALNDVLELARPEAFGRARRLRDYVRELSALVPVGPQWELEAAAILSQIGYVTLDPDTVTKLHRGKMLTPEEEGLALRVPQVTERLLAHIPRLEGVRALLAASSGGMAPAAGGDPHHAAAGILRIALDFDRLEGQGYSIGAALQAMRERTGAYDAATFEHFARLRSLAAAGGVVELPLSAVREGMTLVEDLRMRSGMLLAASGYVITRAFVERARNFAVGAVVEPVSCRLPEAPTVPDVVRPAA